MANEKRLINANALKGDFMFLRKMWSGTEIVATIDEAPTVDAVEVVHGRWIKDKTVQVMEPGGQKYHNSCSVCGWLTRLHNLNYCPNCGAKMDGGNED